MKPRIQRFSTPVDNSHNSAGKTKAVMLGGLAKSAQRSLIKKQAAQHDRAGGGHKHALSAEGSSLSTAVAVADQALVQHFYFKNMPLSLIQRAQVAIKCVAFRQDELQMRPRCYAATGYQSRKKILGLRASPALPGVGTTVGTMDDFRATKKKGLSHFRS